MKSKRPMSNLVFIMLALTAGGYGLHFLLFRDLHHIGIFFISDVAFLPLEVLLVSLVFHKMIESSHKRENEGKINIIESLFFNETGADIIRYLLTCDTRSPQLCSALSIKEGWGKHEYESAFKFISQYAFNADADALDFFALHYHLNTRHKYFLKVIENPALSDNESFTDLVLEIHHLWEELEIRSDLYSLTKTERAYLSQIVSTIYKMLAKEWLINVSYIQKHHAGRFNYAVRSNPFTAPTAKNTII